jgi:hypothetical protein
MLILERLCYILMHRFFNSRIDFLDFDDQHFQQRKRRGRPSSAKATSQKWSSEGENFDLLSLV